MIFKGKCSVRLSTVVWAVRGQELDSKSETNKEYGATHPLFWCNATCPEGTPSGKLDYHEILTQGRWDREGRGRSRETNIFPFGSLNSSNPKMEWIAYLTSTAICPTALQSKASDLSFICHARSQCERCPASWNLLNWLSNGLGGRVWRNARKKQAMQAKRLLMYAEYFFQIWHWHEQTPFPFLTTLTFTNSACFVAGRYYNFQVSFW